MRIHHIFLANLVNQLIGHCSSTKDEPGTSRVSTNHQKASSDTGLQDIPAVENVQLIEYRNGEIIEFQQQNFDDLRNAALEKKELFRDFQFPKKQIAISRGILLRPQKIVAKPVFYDVKHFQVKQGRLGICWFLVGLIHLRFYKNLFNFIVLPQEQSFEHGKYIGIFHFRFWQVGKWIDIVIDDRLPTNNGKLIFTSSGNPNEFWQALIEKAYVKLLHRSYLQLHGGYSKISMQDLSGGIAESYVVRSVSDNLFKIMQDAKERSSMISAMTLAEDKMKKIGISFFNLVPAHAYAITAVETIKIGDNANDEFKLIRICNPHGIKSSNPHPGKIKKLKSHLKTEIDGESWILYEDFIKYFLYIEICNLTPNSLINNIHGKSGGKKLLLSAIEGKWMGGTNIKELSFEDLFANNPQYRIELTEPDQGEMTCNILIGLSLKRRNDLHKLSDTEVYFYIISIVDKNVVRVPKPLAPNNLNYESFGPFESNAQVSARLNVKPGTYYVIPYTSKTFNGASFYLQILSEQENILDVYDRDIWMPHMNNKIHFLETQRIDKTDYQLFLKEAMKNYQTIDFKDLYDILKNDKFSLNKNCHTAHELDDTIIWEIQLLVTENFVPHRKLSYSTIAKTTLITQEIFEIYEEPEFPGYIHYTWIETALKQEGYSIRVDVFNSICFFYNLIENRLIHFNDFIMIVFTFKSKIGSYCEEFSAKLCQDLISMVHVGDLTFHTFDEPDLHDLRINIQHFRMIIKFIKVSKEKFGRYASKSRLCVPFQKLGNLFDAIDYKLTYRIVATMFQTYGNDDCIFYYQFVQSVVDITQIFAKIQKSTAYKERSNLNKFYNDMFFEIWNKKRKNKYSTKI